MPCMLKRRKRRSMTLIFNIELMKEIVPSDTRYIPLTQQPWCCVPTCIQMVMLKHGVALLPAEQLAIEMGLVVPEEDKRYFWNVPSGDKPSSGYGTNLMSISLDTVFQKLQIPLRATFTLINSFSDRNSLLSYLQDRQQHDSNILLCFDWGVLHDDPQYTGGHVCVFDRVDEERVRYIDPSPKAAKWRYVEVEKLYNAMIAHGKQNMAGCWEIYSE